MYAEHQPIISSYALSSPNALARTLSFVILSVRRSLEKVGPLVAQAPAVQGVPRLQQAGVRYVYQNAVTLLDQLPTLQTKMSDAGLLRQFLEIPGLGIPKAGFCMQLIYGKVGCLDSHNIELYGLKPRAFRADGCNTATLAHRCALYVELCRQLGGSEALWDNWVRYTARLRPEYWQNAEHVSAYHVQAIRGY